MNRFPDDFYFKITKDEYDNLRFQNETTKISSKSRSLPFVFTEQGVAMLATVLKTENASITSVNIMRAFVTMRKYINTNLIEQKYINKLVLEHDSKIDLILIFYL